MHNRYAIANRRPIYRADIDGLRAIAVLSVVAYHAFPDFLPGGFVGVDIFFVISGYLISAVIQCSLNYGQFSFASFYIHRVKRLSPALILVLLASYVFGWLVLLPEEFMQLGKNIAGSAAFVSNFVLRQDSGYFDFSRMLKPLLHLWSLGIEEQFYLVWPLLLYVVLKRKTNPLRLTLLIIAASFIGNLWGIRADPVAVFYLPTTRIWEIFFGCNLAFLVPGCDDKGNTGNETLSNIRATLGLALIVLSFVVLKESFAFPGWWALLPTSGAYLLISAGSDAWVNRRLLSHPVLVWFGLISYPLYLWHWPLLSFLNIVERDSISNGHRIAVVLVSAMLAWLTYRLIERPVRQVEQGVMPSLILCVLVAMVGGLGYYTFKHAGLPFRVKNFEQLKTSLEQYGPGTSLLIGDSCLITEKQWKALPGGWVLCKNDKRERASYVLLGDSHATALFPGLVLNSTAGHRWQAIGFMGCEFLTGGVLTTTGLGADYDEMCNRLPTMAVRAIGENPDIRGVLISINSGDIVPNRYQMDRPGSGAQTTEALFLAGMSATVESLQHSGKKIFFIIDNPEITERPAECLFAKSMPLSIKMPRCSITRAEHEVSIRTFRALISQLKVRYDIGVVDPTDIYCDEKNCNVIVNGQSLYSFSEHLSDVGNRKVGDYFLRQSGWR
jgi:peptidoglycan/LPS O-acetylase OafA/YrhL